MPAVVDALGREVRLEAPARRIVSLVPSETEAVCDLAGEGAIAGCTDYCEEPVGIRDRVRSVGGTKKFDVEAVAALAPDLVLANKEENGRTLVETLIERGLPVHVSFPLTVGDALEYLASLATLLGVDPDAHPAVCAARHAYERRRRYAGRVRPVRVFVPIWMEPPMTFDGRVFASDLLDLCGATNVFSDRPRRYPLAADLGRAAPMPRERLGDRDTRYPRIRWDELREREPEAVLLPDEPHRFTEEDARVIGGHVPSVAERGAISFCSGKDLFWYGTRVARAIDRVGELIDSLRPSGAPSP